VVVPDGCGLDLGHEGVEAIQDAAADPEKAGSAGPAEEFSAGSGEQVTAEGLDVERELADGRSGRSRRPG
jgi:hypothetical protein